MPPSAGGWLAAVVLGMAAATSAGAEDLAPFLGAHQKASTLAEQSKWQDVAKVYETLATSQSQDPCAPLASVLQGIILRRELKQADPARAAFERAAKAPQTPFGNELRQLARTWLARLQMEQIGPALERYWKKKVEYPEKLEALVELRLAPAELLVDPWGKPFSYAARALKARPDLPRQYYTLACTAIEGDSRQLPNVLKQTTTFPKKFQLKGIGAVKPLTALIQLDEPGKKPAHVAEGEKIGPAKLIKLTPQGAILADGLGCVAVLPK